MTMLVLNKAEKRKKIHLNRKKCPKCCAPLAHKSARKIKNKSLLLFNQTFPCLETIYHSSALSVKSLKFIFWEKHNIFQQGEESLAGQLL